MGITPLLIRPPPYELEESMLAPPPVTGNPVKSLLSALYGPGVLQAQVMAMLLTQYVVVTALDRNLRVQSKASHRVGVLNRTYAHVLSVYLKVLVEETRKAVTTGDARFFRDFALALEEQHRSSHGRDPMRSYLMMHTLRREAPKTARQHQQRLVEEVRCNVSERHVYRVCKELGIPVAKAREGRPPKTPTQPRDHGRSSPQKPG